MTKTESLKEKIKLQQDKLNRYLNSDAQDILSWNRTVEMSKELDRLIVEYLKYQNEQIE